MEPSSGCWDIELLNGDGGSEGFEGGEGSLQLAVERVPFPLMCKLGWDALDDPARGEACRHYPSINYRALSAYVSRSKCCPICSAKCAPHPS